MTNGTHTAKKGISKPNIWFCIDLDEWLYDECNDTELNNMAYDCCVRMDIANNTAALMPQGE